MEDLVRELRKRGLSNLDIYLALKTKYPSIRPEQLLSPRELNLLERLQRIGIEVYELSNRVNRLMESLEKRKRLLNKLLRQQHLSRPNGAGDGGSPIH